MRQNYKGAADNKRAARAARRLAQTGADQISSTHTLPAAA
jgi:hypothetical protein